MGFKPSEKVLVSLRGVYNLPFNLDDPVDIINILLCRYYRYCVVFQPHENNNPDVGVPRRGQPRTPRHETVLHSTC